jgi:TM2 domain-containing membrane protein YozV
MGASALMAAGSAGGVLSVKTAAIVLNFFLPGVGSLVIGKVGQGVTQLILYWLGVLFTFTLIGAFVGIPLMLAAWIWGMVIAASSDPAPMQVTVIHQQAPVPNPTISQGATTDAVN